MKKIRTVYWIVFGIVGLIVSVLVVSKTTSRNSSRLNAPNPKIAFAKSSTGIVKKAQDKVSLTLGKRLMNLDDVRLGDFSISDDQQVVSVANEEVEALLKELLKYKGASLPSFGNAKGAIANLKILTSAFRSEFPRGRLNNPRSASLSWDKEDQLQLDQLIVDNFDALLQQAKDAEFKALLLYVKAQNLITQKKEAEGVNLFKKISADYSGTEYEMRSEGEINFRAFLQKKYDETIAQSKKILQKYPGSRSAQDANYFLGRAYHLTNDHSKAAAYFDALISQFPNNKWNEGAKYFRAKSHFVLRDYEIAVQEFEEFIQSHPGSIYKTAAREVIGYGYAEQQRFDKAIEAFQKYKEENPSVLEQIAADRKIYSYSKPIKIMKLQERDSVAARHYQALVDDYPRKLERYLSMYETNNIVVAQTYFDLSQYYLNNGDPDKAIEYLEKLKNPKYSTKTSPRKRGDAVDPNYGLIHINQIDYNLARAYVQKGALAKVSQLKEKFAQEGYVYFYYLIRMEEIGNIEQRGNLAEARQQYLKLYEETSLPRQLKARVLYQVANTLYSMQLRDQARETFQNIVNEYPDQPVSRNAQNMVSFLDVRDLAPKVSPSIRLK